MTEITLEQLLQSRDDRAAFQKTLVDAYGFPLVSFTVNMPGAVKDRPQTGIIFRAGVHAIRERLAGRILYSKQKLLATGYEGFFVCHWDVVSLKAAMCVIEFEHPLGRLFDIDVLDETGSHYSRIDLGLGKRPCLICGGDGDACARSKAHSTDALLDRIDRMVAEWAVIH